MANEFKHVAVGTELTQAEYEGTASHVLDSQAAGDIIYASSTSQLSRLGIGTAGKVLHVNSGASAPEWTAALTGVTSIHATDLIIGEDSQTAIDFGTVNEIDFKVDNANRLTLTTGALYPETNNQIDLGTASLEFKDAYFDGTVTADAFAGPLTGTASTATVATTVTITDNESTNEDNAIIFTAGGDVDGGNIGLESDGTLTYNPSTGKITATGFIGALTGNADTATVATTVTITDNESTNEDNAIIFTAGGDVDGGNIGLESDGTLTYNPSTGKITATGFIGALTGNADTATALATARAINGVNFDGSGAITVTAAGSTLSDTVTVAKGGTGATSLTDGGILLGSGTGAITATAVLGDGEVLVGDGTTDPVAESGSTLRTSIGLGTVATRDTGIANNNIPIFTSGAAANDFVRLSSSGNTIEGRSASELLSDISAAPAAGDGNILTVGALDSGSITSGFTSIDVGSGAITTTGTVSGGIVDVAQEAHIDSSPADETVSGITATFTAGEALERGEVVYFKASDSKMHKAVATATGTMPAVAMAAADISADATGKFLLYGFIADNGTFPSYTVGAKIYAPEAETSSQNVPEEAAPDSDGDFVQVVGYAVTANSLFFNPSNDVIEHA